MSCLEMDESMRVMPRECMEGTRRGGLGKCTTDIPTAHAVGGSAEGAGRVFFEVPKLTEATVRVA